MPNQLPLMTHRGRLFPRKAVPLTPWVVGWLPEAGSGDTNCSPAELMPCNRRALTHAGSSSPVSSDPGPHVTTGRALSSGETALAQVVNDLWKATSGGTLGISTLHRASQGTTTLRATQRLRCNLRFWRSYGEVCRRLAPRRELSCPPHRPSTMRWKDKGATHTKPQDAAWPLPLTLSV